MALKFSGKQEFKIFQGKTSQTFRGIFHHIPEKILLDLLLHIITPCGLILVHMGLLYEFGVI